MKTMDMTTARRAVSLTLVAIVGTFALLAVFSGAGQASAGRSPLVLESEHFFGYSDASFSYGTISSLVFKTGINIYADGGQVSFNSRVVRGYKALTFKLGLEDRGTDIDAVAKLLIYRNGRLSQTITLHQGTQPRLVKLRFGRPTIFKFVHREVVDDANILLGEPKAIG